MNVDTGELRRFQEGEEIPNDFTLIKQVKELRQAQKELAGKKTAWVDLTANTPLANFARKERNKRKRKIIDASRKRNRKK